MVKRMGRVLLWLSISLAIIGVGSTVLIAVLLANDHTITWDPTPAGLKLALDQFRFALEAFGAAIAVFTVHVAVGVLIQSMRQNAATAWELTQNNFLAYANRNRPLPISAVFADQLVGASAGHRDPDTELLNVEYRSPLTTLRRLYDTNRFSAEIEPHLNKHLISQLSGVEENYLDLVNRLKEGDEAWLASFVDLAINTRKVRHYLLVTTSRMVAWKSRSILEPNPTLGPKRYPPAFSSEFVADISKDLRSELLCIVDVLHFSQRTEDVARRLVTMALGVGSLWANASDELKVILTTVPFGTLWRESHLIAQRPIELA